MNSKVLVANRGEIAIRAFRAAYELGIGTVAVYPVEDRNSAHRTKADESYQIGEPGHPVRAYLSVDDIVATAKASGAEAIYPGYGFLSENPALAAACASAGITFVPRQSYPVEQGGGDLALALVGAGTTAEEFAADPAHYDIPESVVGFLRGKTRRSTRRLAGTVAYQGIGRSFPGKARTDTIRGRRTLAGRAPSYPPSHAKPAAVPRTDQRVRRPE